MEQQPQLVQQNVVDQGQPWLYHSFFDNNEKQAESIWIQPGDKETLSIQDSEKLLLENEFFKNSKNNSNFTEKTKLSLTQNYIYLWDSSSNTIIGKQELMRTRCMWQQVKINNQIVYGFRLINQQCEELYYTKDQIIYYKWKAVMEKYVVQTQFHDDFSVTKLIGKGSFAKVYLATKKQNCQQYAVKAFSKEYMTNQQKGQESIINEIQIMKLFNSPHLLQLYETYETKNSIYLVVDILHGGEISTKLRQDKHNYMVNIQTIMHNLFNALQTMHEQEIMHRDLKPENILIRTRGELDIVIADFGLSTKLMNPRDILFKRCGTPGFVAPEILYYEDGSEMYNTKCDIFSAAVIMYTLVVGKQPFVGQDYKQILRANKLCKIDYSSLALRKLHPLLVDLIQNTLVDNPNQRFTASQCLNHQYFKLTKEELNIQLDPNFALNQLTNKTQFAQNIQINRQDSRNNSYQLQQISQPAFNGDTQTIGSININSNASIDKSQELRSPSRSLSSQKSKFKYNQNNTKESGSNSKNKSGKMSKNLHKMAIQNSLYKQAQEQQRQTDCIEEEFDDEDMFVSDEGTQNQVQDQIQKLNFNNMVNINKLSKSSQMEEDNKDQVRSKALSAYPCLTYGK